MSEFKGYRPQEIARLLGLSKTTVYRLLASGKLPGRRLGGVWVVLEEDLRQALEEARVKTEN
jgi:excisionase family DNA binding protein